MLCEFRFPYSLLSSCVGILINFLQYLDYLSGDTVLFPGQISKFRLITLLHCVNPLSLYGTKSACREAHEGIIGI